MQSPLPTTGQILEALSTVVDPDLKKDLVSLQMVQDVRVDPTGISFTLVLTTPACPLREQIEADCRAALRAAFPGVPVDIRIDARKWEKKEGTGRPDGIGEVIMVLSGKGGVGKSTVAAGLARGLSELGARVALLDADVHGPSQPTLWAIRGQRPAVGEGKMKPVDCGGVGVLSLGMLIDEGQPLVWRGPMAGNALRQLLVDSDWGLVDYLVVDMPPGTGDVHLTLSQLLPDSYAVVVTTPHVLSLADARKAAAMCVMPSMRIHLLGFVENMSWFTPLPHPDERYFLFGSGGGSALAQEFGAPLLAQLPLLAQVSGDAGNPNSGGSTNQQGSFDFPLTDKPEWLRSPFRPYFQDLSSQLARTIAVHQSNHPGQGRGPGPADTHRV
jgi:ATP-binding protein involved in chromosome partitioning